ncbi:MAG TPA: SBBP repeat-containing protein [Candidatus Sulfotelmatobacter sp.]
MSTPSFLRAQVRGKSNAVKGGASIPVVAFVAILVLIAAGVFTAAGGIRTRSESKPAHVSTVPFSLPQTARPHGDQGISQAEHQRVSAAYAALPLSFEPNKGQTDGRVKYTGRGRGYSLFLTANSAYISLPVAAHDGSSDKTTIARSRALATSQRRHDEVAYVQMSLPGANPEPVITAENQLPGVTNYLIGRDRNKWQTGVGHFGQVRYHDIYPGVDLAFHGASSRADKFEFDFVVNPGAKTEDVSVGFGGLRTLSTTASGDLILTSAAGDLRLHKPIAYQENKGVRRPVDAGFVLHANNRVSFALGEYDHSRQLVIDPTLTYSTYVGGSLEDDANAIAVDSAGNAYITGESDSTDFLTNPQGFDVFVTKLSPTGQILVTTMVGGSSEDVGNAVAIDNTGIYVAGRTASVDFPIVAGGAQTAFIPGASITHGFLFKLNTTGSAYVYSTYIEGSVGESALGLAVDSNFEAYVVGDTVSPDLGSNTVGTNGTVNPLSGGGLLNKGKLGTNDDGFIAKVSSDGAAYLFLSYLGGSGIDIAEGVALDGAGNVYIAGETNSADFFVQGAIQPTCGTDGACNASGGNVSDDAFVTAITASNTPGYLYSTYLGGEGKDDAFAIAADSAGNAYVTGQTFSTQFPVKNALTGLSSLSGGPHAFVASLNPAGTALNYSTYLGGSGTEAGDGIAVDTSGNAYVTGYTTSSDFPVTQSTFSGGISTSFDTDAFVSELNINGTSLSLPFSTFLGGTGDEDFIFGALAVDSLGNLYVTGVTNSTNFPLLHASDGTYNGGASTATCMLGSGGSNVFCPDAFVTVYAPNADFSIAGSPLASVNPGGSSTSTVTVTPFNGYNATVSLTCSVSGGGTPAPQCSLSPASVSGGSGTSTLTVTTTAATARLLRPGSHGGTILFASLLPVAGVAFLGFASTSISHRKPLWSFMALFVIFGGLLILPACGGSSNNGGGGGGGGNPGTPAGTYTVTVTGTDGTITHAVTPPLTLTVN